jgi:hypothetical protein
MLDRICFAEQMRALTLRPDISGNVQKYQKNRSREFLKPSGVLQGLSSLTPALRVGRLFGDLQFESEGICEWL